MTSWTLKQVQGDDPGNGNAWREALRAFRSAEAELRAAERATAGSSAEEEEVWLPAYEARLDLHGAAVRGVMLAAAPDFAAFAAKLELFFEHELEPNSVDDDVLAAMRSDAARLAGLARGGEKGPSRRRLRDVSPVAFAQAVRLGAALRL